MAALGLLVQIWNTGINQQKRKNLERYRYRFYLYSSNGRASDYNNTVRYPTSSGWFFDTKRASERNPACMGHEAHKHMHTHKHTHKHAHKHAHKHTPWHIKAPQGRGTEEKVFEKRSKVLFFPPYQMRELRHDNINPFIGACIDSPSILIVTAYCAKGSLQVRNVTQQWSVQRSMCCMRKLIVKYYVFFYFIFL